MLLQFSLSQKFTLLTGSPLKCLLIIIPSMVIGTSIGSAIKDKIDLGKFFVNSYFKLCFIPLLSFFSLVLIFLILQNFILDLIINNQMIRIVLVIVLSFMSGLVVGPNLPHGLEKICKNSSSAVALAWTVNGFASVFGGIISILVSIVYGFTVATFLAIFLYFLSTIIFAIYNFNKKKLNEL